MTAPISINNIPIRLTKERWMHISLGHPEMAPYYDEIMDTIENPDAVYYGSNEEYIAIKKITETYDKYIVVIYREIDESDGFVITSFFTKRKLYFKSKKRIWKK